MKDFILIHYSEIYLKGKNRPYYEKKLIENINSSLSGLDNHRPANRIFGRIIIKLSGEINEKEYKQRLKKIPGIANFAFCKNSEQEIENIKEVGWELIKNKEFDTFAVRTNRVNKDFTPNSQTTSTKVGTFIGDKLKKNDRAPNVELEDPDQTVYIEIVESFAFIYTDKILGPGGLPVGTTGELLSLTSTGIDSPVAAWRMMRRGCKVSFCHFYSFPFTDKKTKINVNRIVEKLTSWQLNSVIYFINIHEIQKEIIKEIDSKYRLLLYRREMFRLAEEITQQKEIKGLVTGESLGQVASQTLKNMNATSEVTSLPIYRPNIGSHKQEIVDTAKKLDTYDISTEKVEDCCSYMVADHPETKADIKKISRLEHKLELEEYREKAIDDLEIKQINT